MSNLIAKCYGAYARAVGDLRHVLLLLIRLYWGWSFFVAGRGKLMNLERTAEFFAGLGIPEPKLNAVMAASTECVGGLLLLAGVASRVITVPLIVTMVVAYLTAHTDEARALFSNPDDFTAAPPFLFLLAGVIVLVFGPGLFSVDGLVKWFVDRHTVERWSELEPGTRPAAAGAEPPGSTRRAFAYLVIAAVGGLVAGAMVRRNPPKAEGAPRDEGETPPEGAEAGAEGADSAAGTEAMAQEAHVCRGLNACKGQGKDGNNACAGQGSCATAARHACDGLNDCKGQGGCGQTPGQNQCKGQGHCAVPLKEDTWKLARRKFEEEMARQGKKVGAAPAGG